MKRPCSHLLNRIVLAGGLIFLPEFADAGSQEVVINEVLADPVSESTGEFVELFNTGDTPVDVVGWTLADRADVNDTIGDYDGIHDLGLSGTVIPPQGYALIVDPDYAGDYNAWIQQHADLSVLVMLTVQGDHTLGNGLGNSGDTIVLDDGAGVVKQYEWSDAAGDDGVSWEKILPEQGDVPSNWSPAHPDLFATPGARNSVAPVLHDASIVPDDIKVYPVLPSVGKTVTVTAVVRNKGLTSLVDVVVTVFVDANRDSLPGEEEQIGVTMAVDPVDPGNAIRVSLPWHVDIPGLVTIGVFVTAPDDGQDENNTAFVEIRVGFPERILVINEIMFDPGEGSEWIEFVNRSAEPVDLMGWTIETADSTRSRTIVDETLSIPPQHYAILAGDTTTFRERFGNVPAIVLRPRGGWPALLNTGTRITLRDLTGRAIDWVDYEAGWSGESGRSAERIHPDLPSGDVRTWGPSAAESGGTPGMKNSLFATSIPEQMTVDISPNPFSPDGDNWEDEVHIAMHIPVPHAVVRMFIYDVTGRRQRTLLDGEPVGSRRTLVWEGLDDYGRPVGIGSYILYLEMVEPNTGRSQASKALIILAKQL